MNSDLFYTMREINTFKGKEKWVIASGYDGNTVTILDNKSKRKLFTLDCDIRTATYICMINNSCSTFIDEINEKYQVVERAA